MKILYVNSLYSPDIGGGAELSLADVAKGQQARGHEVLVATTGSSDKVVEEDIEGVPVVRLPLRNVYWHHNGTRQGPLKRLLWHTRDINNRAMGQALSKVVHHYNPDVISFQNLVGFSAAAWDVAHAHRKPAVQVLRDYYHLCPRSQLFRNGNNCAKPCGECRLFRIGRAAASAQIQAVVGVSQAVLDGHINNGLFAKTPIRRVINNARPIKTAARTYPNTAVTFGFMGTLAEWKGIRYVIEAFQRLRSDTTLPPLRLLIAGRGESVYEAGLISTYAAPDIQFLGSLSPAVFFAQIDAFIAPSLWHDPLPGVVLESLLYGTPVIGSRRGGIPEMITPEVNGLLFDPDNPTELDACIKRFATQGDLFRRCGEAGLAGSAHLGDMERLHSEYETVHKELIG